MTTEFDLGFGKMFIEPGLKLGSICPLIPISGTMLLLVEVEEWDKEERDAEERDEKDTFEAGGDSGGRGTRAGSTRATFAST